MMANGHIGSDKYVGKVTCKNVTVVDNVLLNIALMESEVNY